MARHHQRPSCALLSCRLAFFAASALLLGPWAGQQRLADAHGYLLTPQSRNIRSYLYDPHGPDKEYTPQGLSGGGEGRAGSDRTGGREEYCSAAHLHRCVTFPNLT